MSDVDKNAKPEMHVHSMSRFGPCWDHVVTIDKSDATAPALAAMFLRVPDCSAPLASVEETQFYFEFRFVHKDDERWKKCP